MSKSKTTITYSPTTTEQDFHQRTVTVKGFNGGIYRVYLRTMIDMTQPCTDEEIVHHIVQIDAGGWETIIYTKGGEVTKAVDNLMKLLNICVAGDVLTTADGYDGRHRTKYRGVLSWACN